MKPYQAFITISILLFTLVALPTVAAAQTYGLTFARGGNYSVRVERIGADSAGGTPEILRPDEADARQLFAGVTDYGSVYGDTAAVRRDFETWQTLEGTVDDTEGRESIVVTALNCRTGRTYQAYADKEGAFVINVNEFADSTVFNIDTYDSLDKRKKYMLSLTEPPLPDIPAPASDGHADNTIAYTASDSARILKNIEVTARRREPMNIYKIEPTKAYYGGDPAIYRHTNLSSLLRTMGVGGVTGATVILDNQVIQRSDERPDEYTFDEDIMQYLNTININEVWQVEYIKNDPRTMMFQSAQRGAPVLCIYTKFGTGGRRALGRPLPDSFTPAGHVPNVVNSPVTGDGDLLLWLPEKIVKSGESLPLPLTGADTARGVSVSVTGLTDAGELVDCLLTILPAVR